LPRAKQRSNKSRKALCWRGARRPNDSRVELYHTIHVVARDLDPASEHTSCGTQPDALPEFCGRAAKCHYSNRFFLEFRIGRYHCGDLLVSQTELEAEGYSVPFRPRVDEIDAELPHFVMGLSSNVGQYFSGDSITDLRDHQIYVR
jgi:hypothetical protein